MLKQLKWKIGEISVQEVRSGLPWAQKSQRMQAKGLCVNVESVEKCYNECPCARGGVGRKGHQMARMGTASAKVQPSKVSKGWSGDEPKGEEAPCTASRRLHEAEVGSYLG